jgi:hypothetical protein
MGLKLNSRCGGSRLWLDGFNRLVEKVLDYFVGCSRELDWFC